MMFLAGILTGIPIGIVLLVVFFRWLAGSVEKDYHNHLKKENGIVD